MSKFQIALELQFFMYNVEISIQGVNSKKVISNQILAQIVERKILDLDL